MNSYHIKLSYDDRTGGELSTTVTVEATSISGAIGKAAREFNKGLDRKQRFDANKGLRIEAVRAGTEKTEGTATAEKSTEASA